MHAEEGDASAGHLQLDADGEQQDDDGDERPVEQEQHQEDHPDADQGDQDDRAVPALSHVGDDRGRSGDIGLDPRRCFRALDDVLDRLHRFVRLGLSETPVQVQLHVGGFAVGALGGTGGERIAPEILDVLDVLGVLLQLADRGCRSTCEASSPRGSSPSEDDDRHALRVGLLEQLAHTGHRP